MIEDHREFGEKVASANYILRRGGYIVVRNARGEIAVLRTPKGYFLPGGGQEGEETPEQAAVREAAEECGMRVKITGSIGTADELVFTESKGKYYRKRCVFFSAELLGCDGGGEDDHELLWMRAEEATLRMSHKSQAWALSKACFEE
jgi:8-oxo-dGTP pyrophosphatase MutT (NUDIX family)